MIPHPASGTWTHLSTQQPFQWIPTWQCLDGFQKSLPYCALDESSLSIGRVKHGCLACNIHIYVKETHLLRKELTMDEWRYSSLVTTTTAWLKNYHTLTCGKDRERERVGVVCEDYFYHIIQVSSYLLSLSREHLHIMYCLSGFLIIKAESRHRT